MSGSLFKRNLKKYGKTISIQDRDINAPVFGSTNFDETFSNDKPVTAIVKTINGKTFFDGVSTERLITHEFHVEYVAGTVDDDTVTAENWVSFKGKRFDILNVENCCEEDEKLILVCTNRGSGEASKA